MRDTILFRSSLLRSIVCLALIAGMSLEAGAAQASLTFKVPPVKIPLTVKDQRFSITASAVITMLRQERGTNVLKLELTADLSGLQQNLTDLLSSELDKDDRCGDRIVVQHATLMPAEPAALAAVQMHFERYTCVKLFGKEDAKKLIGGNAVIQMKITPVVENNDTKLRLAAELVSIEADGTLGELLRSGPLGDMLREKIKTALQSAMQKGSDLGATLPSSVQGYASIQNAQFRNGGAGRLDVVLNGEIRISDEQIRMLSKEVHERIQRP